MATDIKEILVRTNLTVKANFNFRTVIAIMDHFKTTNFMVRVLFIMRTEIDLKENMKMATKNMEELCTSMMKIEKDQLLGANSTVTKLKLLKTVTDMMDSGKMANFTVKVLFIIRMVTNIQDRLKTENKKVRALLNLETEIDMKVGSERADLAVLVLSFTRMEK